MPVPCWLQTFREVAGQPTVSPRRAQGCCGTSNARLGAHWGELLPWSRSGVDVPHGTCAVGLAWRALVDGQTSKGRSDVATVAILPVAAASDPPCPPRGHAVATTGMPN